MCPRCRNGKAIVRRRLVTSVGTLGLPELVCLVCARAADDNLERVARGCTQVDRAVSRHRGHRQTVGSDRLVHLLREAA
jgi:hypothetical protein